MRGTGYYVATLDSSGRRVRSDGLFVRGNGSWTIDDTGLSFLRKMTRTPIYIPRACMRSVTLSSSSWWAGKWLMGAKVVEVKWVLYDGSFVTSGFLFSGKPGVNANIAQLLSP